jgi:serine/threonine-protein kinase
VILFEMLSGRRPADGDDVETIVAAVVSGNVRHLATLEPSLNPGLVAVVERSLVPDRERRFATALEMRLALAPFAGALSHAGRLAASSEPIVHPQAATAVTPHQVAPSQVTPNLPGPNQTGPLQAFDPGRAVPKTLPPEAGSEELDAKGTTQRVSDEAVREALRASALPGNVLPDNFGYLPTALGQPPSPTPHRRRSRSGLWITLSLLLILLLGGGALAAVFFQQHQSDSSEAPLVADAPTPETTVSPLIDAGASNAIQPSSPAVAPITPLTPGRPSNPTITPRTPTSAPTVIRPTDAGAPTVADAGHNNTFPFPFPLPSTLPPLPSTFPPLPKTFPTAFPTALPSGFPMIPGFPFARPAKRDGG